MKYSILDYIKDNKGYIIPIGMLILFYIYIWNSIRNGETGQEELYYIAHFFAVIYAIAMTIDYFKMKAKAKRGEL